MNFKNLAIIICFISLSAVTLVSARCHTSCSSSCSPCTTTTRTVCYSRPVPCLSFSLGWPSRWYDDDDYEVVTYRRPCCRTRYSTCYSPCVKRVRYVTYDCDDDYCW